MGKAARWFRGFLSLKKEETPPQSAAPPKRRWSFIRSHREKYRAIANNTAEDRRGYSQGNVPPPRPGYADGDVVGCADPSRHAIAVAAATAAVAEAAVAAAQAAAEVVRLTSSARPNNASTATSAAHVSSARYGIREERAVVKIQAHFRGYLGRRALRALKGLVKLQALVRGHIVRKQTADVIRRMQALLRAQAYARALRTQISESPQRPSTKSSQFNYHFDAKGPATPEKFEPAIRSKSTKCDQSPILMRNGSKSIGPVIINQDKSHNDCNCLDQRGHSMKTGQRDEEKSEMNQVILEVETGKPHFIQKRKSLFQSFHHTLAIDPSFSSSKDSTTHQTAPSPSSCEVQSLSPSKFTQAVKESPFCTANNSPQFYSAPFRGGNSETGPFGSARSNGARSYLGGYAGHPNYMACTESSKAKMRSLSAPKQRPQFERSVSNKRFSVHLDGDSRPSNQRVWAHFASKACRSSGRLDRL